MLNSEWMPRIIPKQGTTLKELYAESAEDVKISNDLFNRGVESVKCLVKWNANERLRDNDVNK